MSDSTWDSGITGLVYPLTIIMKKTNDLLQNVSIPNSTGYTTMWTNFGHVKKTKDLS